VDGKSVVDRNAESIGNGMITSVFVATDVFDLIELSTDGSAEKRRKVG
jgi:hypothetical protein